MIIFGPFLLLYSYSVLLLFFLFFAFFPNILLYISISLHSLLYSLTYFGTYQFFVTLKKKTSFITIFSFHLYFLYLALFILTALLIFFISSWCLILSFRLVSIFSTHFLSVLSSFLLNVRHYAIPFCLCILTKMHKDEKNKIR